MNVVHVNLVLDHPSNRDEALEVSLIFNGQPDAAQVFEAFQEVPSVFRHKDFELYRRRLFECLETYGVPQLGKFDMVTPRGAPITVPMVYAAWLLNLVSPDASAIGVQIGSIRIGWRTVHNVVQPAAPEDKTGRGEEQEPKATKATTAIRKASLDPARKTPKNRKVKKGTAMKTSFELVSMMNTAFGNPKGDPLNIDWTKVRRQFKNVGHEFCELLQALGLDPACVENILGAIDRNTNPEQFTGEPNLHKVRDSSRDIVVFADGGHHFMGIDGDRDMRAVIEGVMTRFIKDDADLEATMATHAAAGVSEVYFEGEFPTLIMKSASDQPDAPKGKFLKSASYKDTVFYDVNNPGCVPEDCMGCASCGEEDKDEDEECHDCGWTIDECECREDD